MLSLNPPFPCGPSPIGGHYQSRRDEDGRWKGPGHALLVIAGWYDFFIAFHLLTRY
jgi:hypothetical protein